jgi:hypothetical protein
VYSPEAASKRVHGCSHGSHVLTVVLGLDGGVMVAVINCALALSEHPHGGKESWVGALFGRASSVGERSNTK